MGSREELFANAMAALNSIGIRRFEFRKPFVEHNYNSDLMSKPMTTYTRAHKDVMQYGPKFDDIDQELMDVATAAIDKLGFDGFTDDSLDPAYLIHFSKFSLENKNKLNELKNKQ